MTIRLDGSGQLKFSTPQQQWRVSSGGDPAVMQTATFAGHELMAITDDNGGVDLHYLGFTDGPYSTMDCAKAEASTFARAVLDVMKSKIVD